MHNRDGVERVGGSCKTMGTNGGAWRNRDRQYGGGEGKRIGMIIKKGGGRKEKRTALKGASQKRVGA